MVIRVGSGQRATTTLMRSAVTLMRVELPDRRGFHVAIAPLWIATADLAVLIDPHSTQSTAGTLDGRTTEDNTNRHHRDDSHKHQ